MEKLKDVLCCGVPVSIKPDTMGESEGFGVFCEVCGFGLFGENKEDIIKEFENHPNRKINATNKEVKKIVNNNNQRGLVIAPNSMVSAFEHRKTDLALSMNPILNSSTSAMARIWANNTDKYPMTVMKGKAWDKVFSTEEGKQSVIHEIEEAMIMCVELGKSGSIVPFGTTCKFIAEVDGIIFFLTNGQNAPFSEITIQCIYDGDETTSGISKGDFFINIKNGEEKEKVKSVAVFGELNKSGKIVGEIYSAKRMLEKAALHSKPYANYIKMIKAYEYQKSEGKVQRDPNGREFFTYFDIVDSDNDQYFDRSVDFFRGAESRGELKKDNKGEYANQVITPTFTKKIYRSYIEGGTTEKTIFLDSLENPYAGADQPEMLRKTAGKSFLSKYAKVRNSEAAMNEATSHKGAMNNSIDMAEEQFDDDIVQ